MNAWAIAGLIIVVIIAWLGFWTAIMSAISRVGGWSRLATAYPLTPDITAPPSTESSPPHPLHIDSTADHAPAAPKPRRTFSWQSLTLRRFMGYNNAVTFRVMPQGLLLKLPAIFRAGHRPILLPWSQFHIEHFTRFGRRMARLHTQREPQIPILISEKLCQRLADAAGEDWPR